MSTALMTGASSEMGRAAVRALANSNTPIGPDQNRTAAAAQIQRKHRRLHVPINNAAVLPEATSASAITPQTAQITTP